ncbi:hypothetical protein Z043_123971, partial [Scleropages formosus]
GHSVLERGARGRGDAAGWTRPCSPAGLGFKSRMGALRWTGVPSWQAYVSSSQQMAPPSPNTNSSSNSSSGGGEQLSKTNLYIRGLHPGTTDQDLVKLCQPYGKIVSTKAILDKTTNKCKGYGFVDFDSPAAAQKAVTALKASGVQAQMAKVDRPLAAIQPSPLRATGEHGAQGARHNELVCTPCQHLIRRPLQCAVRAVRAVRTAPCVCGGGAVCMCSRQILSWLFRDSVHFDSKVSTRL